jgi:replication fork protection complex subunit Csm3/Swi3
MVEKMGHKKIMHAMRMEWIHEGKPRSSVHEESLFDEPALPSRENDGQAQPASNVAPIFEKTTLTRPKTPEANDEMEEDDDLYDATPRAARKTQEKAGVESISTGGNASIFGPARVIDDGPPDDDDLDALLAEEEMLQTASNNVQVPSVGSMAKPRHEDDFDDDMEAMAAMDDMW